MHHRDLDRNKVVTVIARTLSSIHEIFFEINSFSLYLQGLSLNSKSTFLTNLDNYTNYNFIEEKKSRSLILKASKLK